MLSLAAVAIVMPLYGCSAHLSHRDKETPACPLSVGSAHLGADEDLMLQLRATSEDGAIGDALIRIPKSDARYEPYIRHIGGLKKGQEKLVPPWGCQPNAAGLRY